MPLTEREIITHRMVLRDLLIEFNPEDEMSYLVAINEALKNGISEENIKAEDIAVRAAAIRGEEDEARDQAIILERKADPIEVKQLEYMISNAHLEKKDIVSLFETVVIKKDRKWMENSEKMVDACKYQGFDPGLMAYE
ncbi:hypothetical protein M0802_013905 [Mischocyttarus mexicanus]|nr:hypothetical protein M0802_013905 [Mischocyttarus mexicanus]